MDDDTAARVGLVKALVEARKAFGGVRKDRQNPHLRNAYATIGAILDAVEGPLLDNGIAIVQHPAGEPTLDDKGGGRLDVTTSLYHVGGGVLSATVPAVWGAGKGLNDMQAMGSAISYARRYGLLALLCLTAEDDDDGHGSGPPRPTRRHDDRPAPAPPPRPESPASANGGNGDGRPKALGDWEAFAARKLAGWREWAGEQGIEAPEVHPSRMLNSLCTKAVEEGLIDPAAILGPAADGGEAKRVPAKVRRAVEALDAAWVDRTAGRYLKAKVEHEAIRSTEGGNDGED